MLKQRIITGALLAAAAIAAVIFLPPRALIAVLALATLLACWEWSDLSGVIKPLARASYCVLSACAMVALLVATQLFDGLPDMRRLRIVLGVAALWWCLAWLWIKTFPTSATWWGSVWARLLIGWFALLPAWLACAYLRMQIDGEWKILFLLALVAAADIGAYFSGTKFGRHKLAPAVSPGKSWEGFWGGLAASVALAALVWLLFWEEMPLLGLLLVTALTVLASVLGDLLESMVKRHRGVKDSGSMLPGHGGLLDRFDSISAAAPVFALGLLLTL
ncbi:MAG TPA: phosphatidate cytidylyltransferase [Spongiibacteraceae bacterium]